MIQSFIFLAFFSALHAEPEFVQVPQCIGAYMYEREAVNDFFEKSCEKTTQSKSPLNNSSLDKSLPDTECILDKISKVNV